MRAIKVKAYGPVEMLQVVEVPTPKPAAGEILIKIHAAVVGPADIAFRKAEPFIVRFFAGMFKPKNIPGTELAGEVVAIGNDVKKFRVGDKVMGASANDSSAHAEYICLPENGTISIMPENSSFAEAVSICDGPMTALVFLRDKAKITSGQKILINGASGSVGSAAIQLAKYYGAFVTAVCSSKNFEVVNTLGADEFVDYTQTDFTKQNKTYDIVFDVVGNSSFKNCRNILTETGVYLMTVPQIGVMLQTIRTRKSSGKKAIFAATGLQQNPENLVFLKQLVERGKLKPVIDRSYKLERIREAHRYVEAGHKTGSVVIEMS